ncbi:MAG TPA: glycosyltransferase family 2 protein [Fimbriimonadaceae bacterium]|nr:glycosyltransferase family 2 protein [Fimbriimonadaceae bacterium]
MTVSGCVPTFNNEATLNAALESLKCQTTPLDSIFVIDDGSTDGSATVAHRAGVEVVSLGQNQGRGAARATAIDHCHSELLLSVDGTAALASDFLQIALPHMQDPKVAAVYGSIHGSPAKSVADRWRERHLYSTSAESATETDALITWGCLLRLEAVHGVGNFDRTCRHSEDAELGVRLRQADWKLIYEPTAKVTTLVSNPLPQVLERYWRWNAGVQPSFGFRGYLKMIGYSLKVLARRDWQAHDFPASLVSLWLPHYCALQSLRRSR